MLQLNDIGLCVALERAAGTDVCLIPRKHFAKETPEQGDEGCWYQVRSVIRCMECRRCGVRKERTGFPQNNGRSSLPHLRFLDLEIESDPTSALQSFLGDGGLPSHIQLFDKLKWGVPIMNTNASYMLISRDYIAADGHLPCAGPRAAAVIPDRALL